MHLKRLKNIIKYQLYTNFIVTMNLIMFRSFPKSLIIFKEFWDSYFVGITEILNTSTFVQENVKYESFKTTFSQV